MIEDYYNKTATVKRWDGTLAEGSPDYSDANWDTQETQAGAFYDKGQSEILANQKNTNEDRVRFYCAYDADIQTDDRLTIDSIIYRVISAVNPMERDHHLEVELERLDDES